MRIESKNLLSILRQSSILAQTRAHSLVLPGEWVQTLSVNPLVMRDDILGGTIATALINCACQMSGTYMLQKFRFVEDVCACAHYVESVNICLQAVWVRPDHDFVFHMGEPYIECRCRGQGPVKGHFLQQGTRH